MKISSVKSLSEFARAIETLVREKNIDYLDACMHYAESNQLEVETLASLIKHNPTIKGRLHDYCSTLNLVEKQ